MFTVIAEGDIGGILNGDFDEIDEISDLIKHPPPADGILFTKDGEAGDGVPDAPQVKNVPDVPQANTAIEERQIFISVLDVTANKISVVCLEEYLVGVVFSEMPASFEIEALKAQAVAARSYCVYKMIFSSENSGAEHGGADICTDFRHCKAHASFEEAAAKHGEEYIAPLWDRIRYAVDYTKGEIITYRTEPAIAVFHAISGSETESAENIWGNPVPYLVSVPSGEQNRQSEIRNYITESMFSPNEFRQTLISNGFNADFPQDASVWISDISLNSSGRVGSVYIGGAEITGRRLREIFSLRSTDFTLEYKNQAFIFTVRGYGHGVGMSQYGANLMALDGKSYTEILTWYYTGVEIEQAWRAE
jgi:stage II sporulation protein D